MRTARDMVCAWEIAGNKERAIAIGDITQVERAVGSLVLVNFSRDISNSARVLTGESTPNQGISHERHLTEHSE